MDWLNPKISDYLIIAAVVALMFLLPYLFAISSASSLPQYQDAKSWVESEAVITHASIESRGTRGARHPRIRYRYQFNGQSFEAKRVDLSGNDRVYARDVSPHHVTNRYPVGKVVPVFVDPSNPKTSTLYRGISFGMLADFGCMIMFIGLGLMVLCLVFLERQQQQLNAKARNGSLGRTCSTPG